MTQMSDPSRIVVRAAYVAVVAVAAPVGTVLPAGTIAINGWFNRLLIVAGCAWIVTVAWHAIAIRADGRDR